MPTDSELYAWLREHTVATGLSRWMGRHQFLDDAVKEAMGVAHLELTQAPQWLPPLPEPKTLSRGDEDGAIRLGYTADQMRDYARAALAQRQQVPEQLLIWARAYHPKLDEWDYGYEDARRYVRNCLEAALTATPQAAEPVAGVSDELLRTLLDETSPPDARASALIAFSEAVARGSNRQRAGLVAALKTHAGDAGGWEFGLGRVKFSSTGALEAFEWATQDQIDAAINNALKG